MATKEKFPMTLLLILFTGNMYASIILVEYIIATSNCHFLFFILRKMRKFTWYEAILVLLGVSTIAHYFMMWATYYEKYLVVSQNQRKSKKREKKIEKTETDTTIIRDILAQYRPRCADLLPVLLTNYPMSWYLDVVLLWSDSQSLNVLWLQIFGRFPFLWCIYLFSSTWELDGHVRNYPCLYVLAQKSILQVSNLFKKLVSFSSPNYILY
uniref:DUF1736 domain-containing protein n=1 Tax=Heterorhabditis bacteriophora TaxID=37862 RepID=A0A1I7WZC8_HETBA